jgi:hypothetical protein
MRVVAITRLGLLGGLLAATVCAAHAESHDSPVVQRAASREATHLRLILSSAPPSILDVDMRTLVRVPGVTHGPRPVLWVAGVPGGAVAIVIGSRSEQGFLIRPDSSTRRLATATSLLASWNSSAVWTLGHRRGGGCALRLVPGTRPAMRAPCGRLDTDGGAGVVIGTARGEVLVDPQTGHVRVQVRGDGSALVPLRGDLVFEETTTRLNQTKLALIDLRTGRRRPLRWPSQIDALDGVVAEPNGPLVAVGFANPSSNPQHEDLFLLDTRTGKFAHVPGYPIAEDLKFSSVAWTSDDRLILTIHLGSGTHLGIYRPGDRAVSVQPIRLPAYAGSDTFVPIVSR